MWAVFLAWMISAAALLVLAVVLGSVINHTPLGILIDDRGRYSLTHLQIVIWTIVVLSLVSGVFWGRLVHGVQGALDFSIPNELLVVLGISVGSTLLSTSIKTVKDTTRPQNVAASDVHDKPRLAQIFLAEEGAMADKVTDVAKFQNFVITGVLVTAYVALAVSAVRDAGSAAKLAALPGFDSNFVTLLAISHGGYIAGKLPTQPGVPDGLTVQARNLHATAAPAAAGAAAAAAPTYVPRNP